VDQRAIEAASSMRTDLIEWAVAAHIHAGETRSGDHYVVCLLADQALVAVLDGIGHGAEAAQASQLAGQVLEASAGRPLVASFKACHDALRGTRGVVMTLAQIDRARDRLSWVGVGNVEGRLLRADKDSSHPEETLLLRSGVVGHGLPSTMMVASLQIFKGDTLLLATDGIHPAFASKLSISRSAHDIANDILARHYKGSDDALVLAVKYRGGGPSTVE
jgi:phosphoserine phosphatase RsbX